jgi:ribosomal protein S12 methylthiotransferase accessory factor
MMTIAVSAPPLSHRLAAELARIDSSNRYADRACSAEETVSRMRRRFHEFGITRLAETTGLDCIGLPVWAAVRPNALTLSVCQGKGITDAAAQASAIMEAAEVATAERSDLRLRTASLDELVGAGHACHLMENLIRRGKANPARDERITWLEGFDLLMGIPVFVPSEVVTLDHTAIESRYWRSTDGLASGNLLVEAVLHGLCERVERDACSLWLLRSDAEVQRRCMDPFAFEDEALTALAAQIAGAGMHLRLFDITTNVGVPVFFATVSPAPDTDMRKWKHFDLASGSGCHPLPARAAIRAVTEAVQSRLTLISGARDDFDPDLYVAKLKPDLLAYIHAEPGGRRPRPAQALSRGEYFPFILDRLRSVGARHAIAVSLEAEADGFAVAKVLVPDLENPPGSDRRQPFGRRGLAAMMGVL